MENPHEYSQGAIMKAYPRLPELDLRDQLMSQDPEIVLRARAVLTGKK